MGNWFLSNYILTGKRFRQFQYQCHSYIRNLWKIKDKNWLRICYFGLFCTHYIISFVLIPANICLDEDIFKTSWTRVSSSSSEDVLIKTNLFALVMHFQKTSSRRLDWDEYIRLGHTSSRHLQDVFKTSSIGVLPRHVQDVLQKHLQDNFKTFPRHIMKLNCSC